MRVISLWLLRVMMKLRSKRIYLPDIVGGGYGDFWRFRGRYRVCKGSRASKKSKTTALWFIVNLMKHPAANLLVIRATYNTLRNSCFTELKWAISRLGVQNWWQINLSPLEMTYLPTGQKIYFRGLDDPLKVTSITVDVGALCWMWIEEAYEIDSEESFNTLDESIRGQVPDGLFKQITITFNPWNEHHWLKKRFFDTEDEDVLAKTTNYLCNEFLDSADIRVFERMKRDNPRRYQVAGLGNWGMVDGLVYENFREAEFELSDLPATARSFFGLDFGYTNDPTAFWAGMVDEKQRKIWVFDEMYERGMSNEKIAERITEMGYAKEIITADSAEPKSIDRLKTLGLRRVRAAEKGKDSVLNGIDRIQDYEIIIHTRCSNFITEIYNYTWQKDKFGRTINKPIDDFNHLMDAMRYALESLNGSGISILK